MSVNTENGSAQGQTTVLEKESVYASLFDKINLTPATSLGDINAFLDDAALSDAPAGERLTAAMQVSARAKRRTAAAAGAASGSRPPGSGVAGLGVAGADTGTADLGRGAGAVSAWLATQHCAVPELAERCATGMECGLGIAACTSP